MAFLHQPIRLQKNIGQRKVILGGGGGGNSAIFGAQILPFPEKAGCPEVDK